MVALGVADEVDCWRHLEAASSERLAMKCGTCGTVCSSRGSEVLRISLEASRFKLMENDSPSLNNEKRYLNAAGEYHGGTRVKESIETASSESESERKR